MDMKRLFARMASLELRVPIDVLSTGLDLLQMQVQVIGPSLRGELTDMINEMKLSADVAVGALNDILEYEKLESTEIQLEKERIFVRDFIDDCVVACNIQVTTNHAFQIIR